MELFSSFIPPKEACIVGFSYGGIRAMEYAMETKEFFKKLILISPAFYQHTTDEFRQAQLDAFVADSDLYTIKLLKKSGFSDSERDVYGHMGTIDELGELLYYEWSKQMLRSLCAKGVQIEVYLGGADRIVDPNVSMEFFKDFATVYFIKNKNHFVR